MSFSLSFVNNGACHIAILCYVKLEIATLAACLLEDSDYALITTPRSKRKGGSATSSEHEMDEEERAQNLKKLQSVMSDLASLDMKLKSKGFKSASASGQGTPRGPAGSPAAAASGQGPQEPPYPPPGRAFKLPGFQVFQFSINPKFKYSCTQHSLLGNKSSM